MKLAFLSDVEGRWTKLTHFCDDNPWVTLHPADGPGQPDRLHVLPGAAFVYGGDTIDRGPASRRLLRALVNAKLRQPDQVVLLAGNRDINKLRLPRELGGHPRAGAPSAPLAETLRWTLAHTMGAPDAFGHRAQELADAAGAADAATAGGARVGRGAVSDADVVQSMLDDVAPDGLLTRYLQLAQLAWRHGETLFVHGAVTDQNLGCVPGEPPVDTVDAWVEALNAFFAAQVTRYLADPCGQGHQALIAYQAPVPGTRANPESVVYGRPVDDHGSPIPPSPALRAQLAASGVRRVVVGHTPVGDTPGIVRLAVQGPGWSGGFEGVVADSSYATLDLGSQVLIDGTRTLIRAWARPSGEEVQRVSCDLELDEPSPIGGPQPGGYTVRGVLADGRYLLCRFLPGFRVEEIAVRTLG